MFQLEYIVEIINDTKLAFSISTIMPFLACSLNLLIELGQVFY